jgi:Flp pilus assembly protein TadG
MRAANRARRQSGNAMVEFALTASILFPCLLGVFQFGYGFYIYNRLIASVRDGARYASLRAYDSSTTTPSSAYLAAIRNEVVYGNPAGGTQALVTGLTPDKISVSVTMANGVPDMITVYINQFTLDAITKTFQLSGKPSASFRYEGRYTP